MYLKELLAKNLLNVCSQLEKDCKIKSLSQDSRQLEPGALFFAYPGYQGDGRDYIEEAIKKGAVAILVEQENLDTKILAHATVPILPVRALKSYIGALAAYFYGEPSKEMMLIGITGTNGKTSCSHFLAASMARLHQPCGVIGGISHGLYEEERYDTLSKSARHLTTPDVIELHRLLSVFKKKNVFNVVIEVSSHAIDQGRIDGVEFKIAAFTNLSHDHLDYHKTLQHYADTKKKLFTKQPKLQWVVLNFDDPYSLKWIQELSNQAHLYTYSLNRTDQRKASVQASHIQIFPIGFEATLHTPWGSGVLKNTELIGLFNISNLLLVVTVLGVLGLPLAKTLSAISRLKPVTGRMDRLEKIAGQPKVVIDYAHSPDGLKQALIALQGSPGKLWCIFGCGGNRDVKKRALMGAMAETYADSIVITQDNPRYEDPDRITHDILKGFKHPQKVLVELDRAKAIQDAITTAQPEDVILIAGKGHEDYQIIGNTEYVISDREVAEAALSDLVNTQY